VAVVLGAQGRFDLRRIKADNYRPIDHGDRGRNVAEPLKLYDSFGVLGYIPLLKWNLLLRKILLRPLAEHSAGLCEYRHVLHSTHSSLELLPYPGCP
jgi:hypothetical protein